MSLLQRKTGSIKRLCKLFQQIDVERKTLREILIEENRDIDEDYSNLNEAKNIADEYIGEGKPLYRKDKKN